MTFKSVAKTVGVKACKATGWVCIGCIVPFYLTIVGIVKCHRCLKNQGRKGRRVYLKSHTDHPIPLPLQRQYNLSAPDLVPLQQTPQSTQSRLLTLPYSVRERIIQHLLSDDFIITIHTIPRSPRLHATSVPWQLMSTNIYNSQQAYLLGLDKFLTPYGAITSKTRNKGLTTTSRGPIHQQGYPNAGTGSSKRTRKKSDETDKESRGFSSTVDFALLSACRQLYQESMPLLYGGNQFRFTNLECVSFFLQSIRPQHAAKIKSLSLVFRITGTGDLRSWNCAWTLIATKLKGMVDLYVEVGVSGRRSLGEKVFLEHIKQVSGIVRFKLKVWYYHPGLSTAASGGWDDEASEWRKSVEIAVRRPREGPVSAYPGPAQGTVRDALTMDVDLGGYGTL